MKTFKLFLALTIVTLLSSCVKNLEFINDSFTLSEGVEVSFSSGDLSVVVPAEGGKANLAIKSSDAWTAEIINDRAAWCSLTPTKGSGDATLSLSFSRNEDSSDRNASIILTSGKLTKTVVLTQKHVDALILSSERVDVPFQGKVIDVELRHNLSFSYAIDPSCSSWVREVATKGMETSVVRFEILENESEQNRQGSVVFKGGTASSVLNIYQEGSRPSIVLSSQKVTIEEEEGSFDVEIKSNVPVSYKITSGGEWLKELSTKSFSTNTFHFMASMNTSSKDRTGTIEFSSSDGSLHETVTVTQKRHVLSVDAEKEYQYDSNYHFGEFEVSATEQISIDDIDFFIDHEPNSRHVWLDHTWEKTDSDRYVIRYTVSANETGESREGDFIVKAGDKSVPIRIVQSGTGNGVLQPLERYTDLPREKITAVNFYASSDKKTSRYTENKGGAPIYAETKGSVVNIYTSGDRFRADNIIGWFENCSSIRTLDLRTWDTSGCESFSDLFSFCNSLESVDLSGFDTRNVKTFGQMFRNCISLKSADDVSSFDTRSLRSLVNMFAGVTSYMKIESLDLSGWDVSHLDDAYCTFQMCACLKLLDLSGWHLKKDAELYGMMAFVGDISECEVRCPVETAEHIIGSNAACTSGLRWNLENGGKFYRSSSYSEDGKVSVLQKATSGKGIDLVFMGDGYSDRNISSGKYRNDMLEAIEHLFKIEPFKSHRHLFNIYEVVAVSENEHFYSGAKTAFGSTASTPVFLDQDKCTQYAMKAVPGANPDNVTAVLLLNTRADHGSAYLETPGSSDLSLDYASGFAISACGLGAHNLNVLYHEMGHAFGKLDEEYVKEPYGVPDDFDLTLKRDQKIGWWTNLDSTDDLSKIRWHYFISDSRYASQNIGAYEGGNYQFGVWRPTEDSVMRYNNPPYNAPSRETIYRRINTLAFGPDWKYDLEKFKQWDLEHQSAAPVAASVNGDNRIIVQNRKKDVFIKRK